MFDASRPDMVIEVNEPKGPWGRARGLIGSAGLGEGRGMLLKTRQVHTFGMAYAIDAIYLSGRGEVLKVRTLPPGRFGPLVWPARWVLEMKAGEAARLGIAEGSSLSKETAQ